MGNADVISKQAQRLLEVEAQRDEALRRAIEAEEKLKKAEEIRQKWYGLAQQRLQNFITAKKDRAQATKELTEWRNKHLPEGIWARKLYNVIIFWDKLKTKS